MSLRTGLKVFIGWDRTMPEVSEVCAFSLLQRASVPVTAEFLQIDDLTARGLYRRARDPLAATEFTYSRFLVPRLVDYQGLALFCDNDFLWLDDIAGLLVGCIGPRAMVRCLPPVRLRRRMDR